MSARGARGGSSAGGSGGGSGAGAGAGADAAAAVAGGSRGAADAGGSGGAAAARGGGDSSPPVKKQIVSMNDFVFTGKVLGKGNFARVEEAVHKFLNVKVAIKIINTKTVEEKYVLRHLYRESKILSKLNHPNILSLFEARMAKDHLYMIICEFIGGGDLYTYVKNHPEGHLSEATALAYTREFSSALYYMHQLGVVHRDLKMENVMLNSTHTHVKIVDFGLSNEWGISNPLRTHCGSPEYAAPELFVAGRKYGSEIDIWSLGIMLYGMVVGKLPFISEKRNYDERKETLIHQINMGLMSYHRRAIAHLSAEFRCLIGRLLQPDRNRRISSRELMFHPWLTESGKKHILVNPVMKHTEELIRSKVNHDVCQWLNISLHELQQKLKDEPYGRIGCLFNIQKALETSRTLVGEYVVEYRRPSRVDYPRAATAVVDRTPLYTHCVIILNKIFNTTTAVPRRILSNNAPPEPQQQQGERRPTNRRTPSAAPNQGQRVQQRRPQTVQPRGAQTRPQTRSQTAAQRSQTPRAARNEAVVPPSDALATTAPRPRLDQRPSAVVQQRPPIQRPTARPRTQPPAAPARQTTRPQAQRTPNLAHQQPAAPDRTNQFRTQGASPQMRNRERLNQRQSLPRAQASRPSTVRPAQQQQQIRARLQEPTRGARLQEPPRGARLQEPPRGARLQEPPRGPRGIGRTRRQSAVPAVTPPIVPAVPPSVVSESSSVSTNCASELVETDSTQRHEISEMLDSRLAQLEVSAFTPTEVRSTELHIDLTSAGAVGAPTATSTPMYGSSAPPTENTVDLGH